MTEPYTVLATRDTPALIIYLIDVSASMTSPMRDTWRINVVKDAIYSTIQTLVRYSTKGPLISPRYRIAMYCYSDEIWDVLGGIQTIDTIAQYDPPEMGTSRGTNAALAFNAAKDLLVSELPNILNHPAPLVCHLTDGEFDPGCPDPEPIASEIMNMAVNDGNVLVENIFISDKALADPFRDAKAWNGIDDQTILGLAYADKLRRMSSYIPRPYLQNMREKGYSINSGSRLFFPGDQPDMVGLGFQISTMTGLQSKPGDSISRG